MHDIRNSQDLIQNLSTYSRLLSLTELLQLQDHLFYHEFLSKVDLNYCNLMLSLAYIISRRRMRAFCLSYILFFYSINQHYAFQSFLLHPGRSLKPSLNNAQGPLFVRNRNNYSKSNVDYGRSETSTLFMSSVKFVSPLLADGFLPSVKSYETGEIKPILLYLPGFDGTLLAPFLQFPELGRTFDVRGMNVDMSDRSTFEELRETVIQYILKISSGNDEFLPSQSKMPIPIYLMGESFGGILASSVALKLQKEYSNSVNLCGLTLVNPATSYLRSQLAKLGPPVYQLPSLLYPLGIISRLVPLFVDQYQLPQLLLILTSEGLPSVIDTPDREAYMGRVALSLPQRLKFMPQDTLKWRLEKWLTNGCNSLGEECEQLKSLSEKLRTLIIVGEDDKTLPSVEEANRLRGIIPNSAMFVVEGAGHASTCGSRVDLAALLRGRFHELQDGVSRIEMKEEAKNRDGKYFGMESRYDGNTNIGMLPTRYWDEDVYKKMTDIMS